MNELINIIEIGGPVLATASIFLFYSEKKDKRTCELIENHLRHSTEAINKNTVVLEKLFTLIRIIAKKNGLKKKLKV
jgi:hypothetical protein